MFRKVFVLLVLFSAGAAWAQPPFTTTTIVNGNGTPVANGAALLAAVAAAVPPALIKVEPGTYNLSGAQLVMRNQVDVEGSGRDVTFIVSDTSVSLSNATVRVPAGIRAELRQLTVQHISNSTGTGISIDADGFLLTEVTVETIDGENTVGIAMNNSSARLNEVFVRALSEQTAVGVRVNGGSPAIIETFSLVASEGPANIAWEIADNADAFLDRCVALTFGAKNSNTAMAIHNDASVEMYNVRGTALGGSSGIGLHLFKNGFAEVKESTFKATSDNFAVAFLLEEANAKATESTFIADPITFDHLGVYAVRLVGPSNLDSNQSNYDGTAFAAQNVGSGQARFGASQLIGSVLSTSFSGLRCIFSYRGNYTARNAACG